MFPHPVGKQSIGSIVGRASSLFYGRVGLCQRKGRGFDRRGLCVRGIRRFLVLYRTFSAPFLGRPGTQGRPTRCVVHSRTSPRTDLNATPRATYIRSTPPMPTKTEPTRHARRLSRPRESREHGAPPRPLAYAPPLESSKIQRGAPPYHQPRCSGPIPLQALFAYNDTENSAHEKQRRIRHPLPHTPLNRQEMRGVHIRSQLRSFFGPCSEGAASFRAGLSATWPFGPLRRLGVAAVFGAVVPRILLRIQVACRFLSIATI